MKVEDVERMLTVIKSIEDGHKVLEDLRNNVPVEFEDEMRMALAYMRSAKQSLLLICMSEMEEEE